MKKTIFIKILVIAIIVTTFSTFLATAPTYAAGKIDDFYYKGTSSSSYSVSAKGGRNIVDVLAGIADWILGVMTMGVRAVFVGWIELFEWVLVRTIDAICKTDMATSDKLFAFDIFQSITDVDNRVTIEKIVFNKIPIFDVNIFNFSDTTNNEESDAE